MTDLSTAPRALALILGEVEEGRTGEVLFEPQSLGNVRASLAAALSGIETIDELRRWRDMRGDSPSKEGSESSSSLEEKVKPERVESARETELARRAARAGTPSPAPLLASEARRPLPLAIRSTPRSSYPSVTVPTGSNSTRKLIPVRETVQVPTPPRPPQVTRSSWFFLRNRRHSLVNGSMSLSELIPPEERRLEGEVEQVGETDESCENGIVIASWVMWRGSTITETERRWIARANALASVS